MRKFNAKIGREVTYKFYPQKRFVIENINQDGTLDLAIGVWLFHMESVTCEN